MDIRLNNIPLTNGRCYIGIAAQQEYVVGLFELVRIHQVGHESSDSVCWIRPFHSPLSDWVRPIATFENDMTIFSTQQTQIEFVTGNTLRLNREGRISTNLCTPGNLTRIQYTVRFWEESDHYPVFSLFPDRMLPWQQTVRCAFRLPLPDWRMLPVRPTRDQTQPIRQISNRPRRLSVDTICPISLESLTMEEAYWLPCGHAFSSAIYHAIGGDARCPLCRSDCELTEIDPPS